MRSQGLPYKTCSCQTLVSLCLYNLKFVVVVQNFITVAEVIFCILEQRVTNSKSKQKKGELGAALQNGGTELGQKFYS